MKKLFIQSTSLIALTLFLFACGGNKTKEAKNDTIKIEKKEAPKKVEINLEATQMAYIMGGMELKNKTGFDSLLNTSPFKQHYDDFEKGWSNLEKNRLSKMRTWRDQELAKVVKDGQTLFYPFSGPDFINAYEFFPNCDNYLMFGLEPAGVLPNKKEINANYLGSIRRALSEIFTRNYFITSYMGGSLSGKGVLPIVMVFMARTNNQIVAVKRVYLEKDGTPKFIPIDEEGPKDNITGIMIEFLNEKKTKSQKIYYFGTNVVDAEMAKKTELATFISSFKNQIGFVKSCSYTLHSGEFSIMRGLVMDLCNAVLQDDTGVRYEVYEEAGWDIQLYGKYARPIADFGDYTYQPRLRDAFKTESAKPLGFTYGYHWNTDNTSVLLAIKNAERAASLKKENKKEEPKKEAKKEEAKKVEPKK
jgi:hypothetical protein